MEDIDEGDHDNSPQKTPSASSEASIQQEHPTSLILDNNKSSLLEISIEQSVPIDDSVTLSSEVDRSELPSNEIPSKTSYESCTDYQQKQFARNFSSRKILGDSIALSQDLPSTNKVPDGFPSSVSEAYESKGTQDDPIVKESSEVNVLSQYLLRSREEVQFDVPCADPVIPKKLKEDKNIFVQRLQKRQISLAPRQQVPAPVSRSVSVKNLRMDNTTVDTTTHIESVKVAASKFGGSINWKTRRGQPPQESGQTVLELDKLKNEISECKRQAEASEIAMMSVFDDLEKTNKFIDELKHVLERKQAEEVDAKEDLEIFQFIVQEIQEGVVSDDSAYTLSQETKRQVEDLTLKLKRLREHLDLDRATLHDAEERMKEATILREIDCSLWEVNLRQAEEELKKCEKLSSIEELKSELDTSSNLLLNLKNELAMCTETYPTEEALEQEGGTYKSMEKVIPPRNELEEYNKSIAKVTNELCALKITAATLKSELNKEQVALAAMQQREAMASITVQSLKMDIKHSLMELEAVHAKAKCRDGMVELPKFPQNAAWEADKAKSVAAKAQEELRKTREEIEQIKAALSTMELKLLAVQREIEDAKESERLTLSAIRQMEDVKAAVNIELGSHQMITVDLDEYTSLSEKAHRAEALVHERTIAAIALVEAAKTSESQTLSRLDEFFKALEERKQALLDATEQADRATEGKLAMEHELRKWREEGKQRRRAGEASKSKTRSSRAEEIIVERGVDAKCTSKEESCASVHPLSDASGRSSPNDLVLNVKVEKTRKLSFFPRVIMFLGRRRRKALR
ncbi:hypothetical protein PR202_gb08034 [Eleusine coracana subsp. coracana]|uniref:Uncharacterized protein n=1 Tax=Eleusine coracana subsp. coracana TaxID=191504 RepID=A0AAV5EC06_ELECO|nr:hypothetical protein PR202_gb08034 [Eleusine coracana subsp. coracana]